MAVGAGVSAVPVTACRNRIVAGAAPGIAPCDPSHGEPAAAKQAVPVDRFPGIGRAARRVAAVDAEHRREPPLPEENQRLRGEGGKGRETRHRSRPTSSSTTCDPPSFPSRHARSEEHTSELQSLMRNSYAVFRLKKKKNT